MPIPRGEPVFRFLDPDRDYHWEEDGEGRVSSFALRDSQVSLNRSSVWSLQRNPELAPAGWGLFSITCNDLRSVAIAHLPQIEIDPAPLDLDPLLQIPNPAHCNLNRQLKQKEAGRAAKIASQNLHRRPVRV